MPRRLVLHSALALGVLCAWLLLPRALAPWATALILGCGIGAIAWLVTSPRSQWLVPTIYRAEGHKPCIAFTFDDGPDPIFTPQILDLLREFDAKATFFVVGERALAHPAIVQRAVAEGHLIGSHSFRHAMTFHFTSTRAMALEIERGIDAIEQTTAIQPLYFRPPQGLRVPTLRDALSQVAARKGLAPVCVTWSARGKDSLASTPAAIVSRLRDAVVGGAILTLHDGTGFGGSLDRAPTLIALRQLLELARSRRLRAVRLDDLLQSASIIRASELPP